MSENEGGQWWSGLPKELQEDIEYQE